MQIPYPRGRENKSIADFFFLKIGANEWPH